MINWEMIKAAALALVTLGVSVLIARYGAAKKKEGENNEKLKQFEKAVEVIEKDRELQDEANKIEETINSRDKSDRSGLLHYATADSGSGDASKEDSANA